MAGTKPGANLGDLGQIADPERPRGGRTDCMRRGGRGGRKAGVRNRWRGRSIDDGREPTPGRRHPPGTTAARGAAHRDPAPRISSLLPPPRARGGRSAADPASGPDPWGGRDTRPRGRGSPRSSCCSAAASSPGRWQPPPTIASSEKRRGPAAGPGGVAAAAAAAIFGAPRCRAAPRPRPLCVSAAKSRPLMSPAANGRARRGESGRRGRGGRGGLKGAMAGWGRRVGPGFTLQCCAVWMRCDAMRCGDVAWGTAGECSAACRSAGYGYWVQSCAGMRHTALCRAARRAAAPGQSELCSAVQ